MKKCQQCTKAATLHITELKDGVAKALHLCESCAQDYLSTSEMGGGAELDDDLEKTLAGLDLEDVDEPDDLGEDELAELNDLSCPNCGVGFKEFRKIGRLGCPHCYDAFRTEMVPLLENIHGETEHVGKWPKRAPGSSEQQHELIRLRNELRNAVDGEDYEAAAGLRDRINSLEESLG